jgi:very-short-patch-repair endonuclease
MKISNILNIKNKRKFLRRNMTSAERIIWDELRKYKLGFKFRRQFSIGHYILDFYCPQKRLAIEIDGEVHQFQKEYDHVREVFLEEYNINVLRFENGEIKNNIQKVLSEIKNHLTQDKVLPFARGGAAGGGVWKEYGDMSKGLEREWR